MLPKISIITPSYNQGHFIEETICSVLDQGYPNLEYIIMDGGSTDNSAEVIKKYEKHLTYWVSEKDKGQSDALNKGYKRATGDVINWLNSDDYYYPGALKAVGGAFANPAVNIYCGISRIFGNKGEYFSNGTDVYAGNLEKTIGWARIDQPETFFRKSCIDKIGFLDEQFHYIMDKELWIRYLLQYGLTGVVKDKTLIANFRIHDDSKTNQFHEKFSNETNKLYCTIAKLNGAKLAEIKDYWPDTIFNLQYKDAFIADKLLIDKVVNYSIFYQFEEAYALNNFKEAKKIAGYLLPDLLQPAEAIHVKDLKARMLMPAFVKKIVNKLR
jgi:glycosyltransferase involved in cell wall biosynthesis